MSAWIHSLIVAAQAATWGALLLLVLRVTVIVACGRLALALMPKASAATRHLVSIATLGALLALPVLMTVVPAWRVPILPQSMAAPRWASKTIAPPAPAQSLVVRTIDRVEAEPADGPSRTTTRRSVLRPIAPEPLRTVRTAAPVAPVQSPLPGAASLAIVIVLLAVTEMLLIRLVLTSIAAGRLSRSAAPVTDPRLTRTLDAARDRLGVRRHVRLMSSGRVAVPVVVGMRRPALLLPADALTWDRDRLEVVFLHELAHVRRGDAWSLLMARAASALYWFHPMVVTLVRDARNECERACDDWVLTSGVRPSSYAEQLLAIARSSRGREVPTGAVLAIARPSNLERRLSLILSSERRRGAASRSAVALTTLFTLALLLPLASARVTAAPEHHRPQVFHTIVRVVPAIQPTAEVLPTPEVPATPTVDAVPAGHSMKQWNRDMSDMEGMDASSGKELWSRAKQLYDDERYGEAGDAYVKTARAGYRIETALYNGACSYALAGRSDDALRTLSSAVGAGWDDAGMLRSDDDLQSIRRDPRFQALLSEVRSTDSEVSKKRSALATLEVMRAGHSDDASAWGSVGIDLMRAGEAERASQAFEEQLRLEPGANAFYNLGCALALNHETGRALEALRHSVAEGYDDANHMAHDDDLNNLHGERGFDAVVKMCRDLSLHGGLWDDDRGSWRSELPEYERMTQQYPNMGKAWFNLGFAQLRAEDPRSAAESFHKALELDYRPATTQYNLACCAAQLRDAEETVKWLARAEAAGMNLNGYLRSDHDLDPVRSDARFRALEERHDDDGFGLNIFNISGKHKHKDKDKDKGKDSSY